MKKIVCLLLVLIMTAASFAACSKTPGEAVTDSGTNQNETKKQDDPGTITDPPSCAAENFANAKNGDILTFGSWDQDGKNGGEPVSWIVLYQGVGKALVLSEKILEYQCFKNGTDEDKYPRALYRDSDVRAFLNGEFYNNAFSDEEKAAILEAKITSEYKDEKYNELTYETQDKVFLLSRDETARYVCGVGTYVFGYPTQRVLDENPYMLSDISNVPGVEKAASWWLRDMGTETPKTAAYVYAASSQRRNYDEAVYNKAGVRPAMWVVYNAKELEAYEKGEAQPKEDEALNKAIAALKAGDKLKFGKCDKNAYNMDGYEDIIWTVLSEDNGVLLLISDDQTGSRRFTAKNADGTSPDETSWAESDLRKYLNDPKQLDTFFSPQEKAKLVLSHVVSTGEDDRSGGAETDDYLFIPDQKDIEQYFSSSSAGIGFKYWLRSQLMWSPRVGCVYNDGTVSSIDPYEVCGVRLMARIKK